MGLLFAPAQPGRQKKKKKRANESKAAKSPSPETVKEETAQTAAALSRNKPKMRKSHFRDESPTPSLDTPTKAPPAEEKPKRQSRRSSKRFRVEDAEKDDEVWYTKWWMFCFADLTKSLIPKR